MTTIGDQTTVSRQFNLDGLRDLLSVVNSSRGIEEILAYLVRKAHDVLESDGAAVYLLDAEDATMLRAHASYGIASSLIADTAPVGYPVTGLAVSLRRPVVISNMAAVLARDHAQDVAEQYEDRGDFVEVMRPGPVSRDDLVQRHRNDDIATLFTTLITVPLMAHDETFGALELFYRDELKLGPEHIDISLAFAQQAALALENARLRTQAEQRLAEIGRRQRVAEALRDLLAVVNSNHDLTAILAELLKQSSRLLGNDAGAIYLKEHDGDTLMRVKASMGLQRNQLAEHVRIGSPTTGLAVEQVRTLVCWDLSEALGDQSLGAADTQLEDFGSYARIVRLGPRTDPDLETDSPRQPRVRQLVNTFRAVVSTPLVARGRTLGAITLFHAGAHQFEREEVELVQAFAQQASLAIENAHLHAEAEQRMLENERRRRVAEAMRDVLAMVNSGRSLDEILNLVLEQTSDLLGSDAGSVLLIDGTRDKPGLLTVRASRSLASELLPLRLPIRTAITGVAVERRRPVAVGDLSAADGFPHVERIARHYKALLAVPLILRGEVVGAVTLYYRAPREFTPEEVTLAESFADQTALAMENARLHEQTLLRSRDLEALYRADEALYRSLRLEQVLQALVDVAADVLQADMTSVLIWDERHEHLIPGATRGFAPESVSQMSHAPGEGITTLVALSGEPVAVEDAANDPRVAHRITDTEHIQSLLHVPISVNGAVFGVFGVNYREKRTFAGEEERVLLALAHRAAVAIEHAQLFAQSEQRLHELEALYRADEVLHSSLLLHDVLRSLVDVAAEVLHAETTTVHLFDSERKEYVMAAAHGDTRVASAEDEMRVPITVSGQTFGLFGVCFGPRHHVTRREQRVVHALAQRAGLAIHNARLFEQAQHVATIEERERLARELHDAVTQTLFSASLIAEVVPRLWDRDPEEGRKRVEDLRRLTRGALSEMRTLLLELRPAALVETPLVQLLAQLAETTISRSPVDVKVHAHGEPVVLAPDVHVALYRIVQEALNNTAKHAAATHASIHLCWRGHGVDLRVKDDGRGFVRSDSSRGRLGLGIMDERAHAIGADLRVRSTPGLGTTVDVHWRSRASSGR